MPGGRIPMNKHQVRQSCLLFLAAFIWGVAFVAQSNAMAYVEPFTFMAVRNYIGSFVLVIYLLILKGMGAPAREPAKEAYGRKTPKWMLKLGIDWYHLLGGMICGTFLCIAGNLQQIGIQYTSVCKTGFLTAVYIILVPILGIFLKKKAGIRVWLGVAIALAGLYLLCVTEKFTIVPADFMLLGCALVFAMQILAVDFFIDRVDGVKLSCIQFFTCAVLSTIGMVIFEHPSIPAMLQAWLPILYAGVLSSGVAYTLQVVGQRDMNPTVASMILSLESVFSALAGWVLLKQVLSTKELLGCGLVFVAIILAQLPGKPQKESGKKM